MFCHVTESLTTDWSLRTSFPLLKAGERPAFPRGFCLDHAGNERRPKTPRAGARRETRPGYRPLTYDRCLRRKKSFGGSRGQGARRAKGAGARRAPALFAPALGEKTRRLWPRPGRPAATTSRRKGPAARGQSAATTPRGRAPSPRGVSSPKEASTLAAPRSLVRRTEKEKPGPL